MRKYKKKETHPSCDAERIPSVGNIAKLRTVSIQTSYGMRKESDFKLSK